MAQCAVKQNDGRENQKSQPRTCGWGRWKNSESLCGYVPDSAISAIFQDSKVSKRSKNERYCFKAIRRSSVDAFAPPFHCFSREPRRSAKLFVTFWMTSATRSSACLTESLGSSTNLLWMASQRARNFSVASSSNNGTRSLLPVLVWVRASFSATDSFTICPPSAGWSEVSTTSTVFCCSL